MAGIPGIIEDAISSLHGAISELLGTTPPVSPTTGLKVMTAEDLKKTGLTVDQATALGYEIVP